MRLMLAARVIECLHSTAQSVTSLACFRLLHSLQDSFSVDIAQCSCLMWGMPVSSGGLWVPYVTYVVR